jgi:hypothetical protein
MMSGDFQLKLRRCNRRLRIHCGDNPNRAAAVYDPADPEVALVGIDKNLIPEFPIYDEKGRMVKGGWRRAIEALIKTGWLNKQRAEKVFGTEFNSQGPKPVAVEDQIMKAVDEVRSHEKVNKLDLQDVAQMIRAEK